MTSNAHKSDSDQPTVRDLRHLPRDHRKTEGVDAPLSGGRTLKDLLQGPRTTRQIPGVDTELPNGGTLGGLRSR